MYSHLPPNYALLSVFRAAWGANQTTRYPLDPYDRIVIPWIGFLASNVENEAVTIEVPVDNRSPPTVLKNAITTSSTLWRIDFDTNLPKKPTGIHIATYYSEVNLLNSTDRRSFQLYIDDKIVSDPILPHIVTNRIASALNNLSALYN
ncbi:hypothetical protein LWI28_000243 [Acer negundo]|uniref:Malectin-like domain-containing protein n=1 Tax=Acer negundo TaxID=4023 RepID=A0AAD5NP91_ACENE|nr:hypothetical protein LWI28_000243 [Acer negundo]KAK4844864.1 hypothetical protein QYF36_025298 [Acer negundo]